MVERSGSDFLDAVYTGPIRSWIRRIGIFHAVLRSYGNFFRLLYWLDYRLRRPKTAALEAGPHSAIFIAESFPEFARIRTSGSERRIVKKFLRHLRPGDAVYDVGASIGIYTVLTARAISDKGAVVAFEPEPQSRERLLQNLALNEVNNVKVFDKGLGDKPIAARLTLTGGSFVSGAHGMFYDAPGEFADIEIIPGDALVSEMRLPLPCGVKIDVEGFEYEVLMGLRETLEKTSRCTVLIEVHFSVLENRGMSDAPRKIRTLLEGVGFTKFEWLGYSHLLAIKN